MLNRLGSSHILVPATLLAGIGVVMVYSASALRAEYIFGTPSVYLLRQLSGLALGIVAALSIARLPLDWIRSAGLWVWGSAVLLLLATLSPLGIEANGARRWLSLGPVSFQPLELAKIGLIVGLAQWLADHSDRIRDVRVSIGIPTLLTLIPVGLLLLQPDFGGALMLVLFAGVMIFVAGARLGHIAVCGLAAAPMLIAGAVARGYRISRIEAFIDPWADPFGQGYQLIQSLLAFGAGGVSGIGLGAGQQKLGYLPEAHTDFILSVVGEELGLVGVIAVLLCFAVLGLATIAIALRARNTHATLLVTGAGMLIWLQGSINAAVAMGLLPTTGATLPLLSYGRTSLIVSLAAVGLVLAAARPRRSGRTGWLQ